MFDICLFSVLGEVNMVSSSSSLNLVWVGVGLISVVGTILYLANQNRVNLSQDVIEKAKLFTSQIQEETEDMTDMAKEKIDLFLEEYKQLLPYIEELGLTVQGFSIEAGLLPQIKTSLRGSIDTINPEVVERIKEENKTNKLLIAILNAILVAQKCHQKLESVYISVLKDIIVDIKLGIPPSILIRFQ